MSQHDAHKVIGKKAIDSTARDVGKISDIGFNDAEGEADWIIKSFHLKIPGQICVELGLSKFKLGSKTVLLPPDMIRQIGDNVQLTIPIAEVVSKAEMK